MSADPIADAELAGRIAACEALAETFETLAAEAEGFGRRREAYCNAEAARVCRIVAGNVRRWAQPPAPNPRHLRSVGPCGPQNVGGGTDTGDAPNVRETGPGV